MNQLVCGSSHHILFSHVQLEGSQHQLEQMPCEDAVFQKTEDSCLFYGLADGQSGAEYGPEGGMACLRAVSDYILSVGIENLIHAPFPDELPCAIVKAFRRELLLLAKRRKTTDLKCFASTLLAVAIDLKTGNYILFHLGDGCVVSIPHTGEPILLSAPDHGLTSCCTWLTTSDNAVAHFRVTAGSLENTKRLLLLSDGAVCFCRGRNIPWRAKDLLKNGSHTQLQESLMQSSPSDDATCIILDFRSQTHR